MSSSEEFEQGTASISFSDSSHSITNTVAAGQQDFAAMSLSDSPRSNANTPADGEHDSAGEKSSAIKLDDEIQRHLSMVKGGFDDSESTQKDQALPLVDKVNISPAFSSLVKSKVVQAVSPKINKPFPMYGFLGLRKETYTDLKTCQNTPRAENLVYSNTNAPWSAFICGQQGAGKSYTLSCLLENALLPGNILGANKYPPAGVVFHFDKYAESKAQICEAVHLCSEGIKVQVLVSRANLKDMENHYYLNGSTYQPEVKALEFQESQLNTRNMKNLMAMSTESGRPPLYMSVLLQILSEMAEARPAGQVGINYSLFKRKIARAGFTKAQLTHLNQRLRLLESLLPKGRGASPGFKFEPGTLTIVDLSDPASDEAAACALYSICLDLFIRSRESHALIVALDEAHKFLTDTAESALFTEDLMQIIRQQRHNATRVVVATQEPTLSPKLLDLCDVTIVHRFRSQAWYNMIQDHLAGLVPSGSSGSAAGQDVFKRIVGLETGEALMFCPDAYLDIEEEETEATKASAFSIDDGGSQDGLKMPRIQSLKSSYIKLQIRERRTRDGGKCIKASDDGAAN